MDKNKIMEAKKEWERICRLGLDDILGKPSCLIFDRNPYVYVCYNKDDKIIYVGRTQDIESRMYNHYLNDYWWEFVDKIYIGITNSETDMAIYEIYYINKYKPIYNTKDKFSDSDFPTLQLEELSFIRFIPAYLKYKKE